MKFTSNHIPHKRFVSGICKEQLKCNNKKINSTILKWAKDSNRRFLKEDAEMANVHIKISSRPLVIMEIQIQTTMRCCFISTRMSVTIKIVNNKCLWGYGEIGNITHWKAKAKVKVTQSSPTLCDPYTPWNSLGQNTGVGSHSLRQGIFPTKGSNPGLLGLQADSLPTGPQGKPSYITGGI